MKNMLLDIARRGSLIFSARELCKSVLQLIMHKVELVSEAISKESIEGAMCFLFPVYSKR